MMASEVCIQNEEKQKPVQKEGKKQAHYKGRNYCACNTCDKRLKLTDMTCRCEKVFCSKHRIPEAHACTFNYRAVGKTQIKEENPLVVPEKISNI